MPVLQVKPEFPRESIISIDLSLKDAKATAALVRKACLDSGFFYVINHGIDQSLIEEVFNQSKKFFSLPEEEKLKLFRDKKNRGYTPFKDEALDYLKQKRVSYGFYLCHSLKRGDCKEGFYIGPKYPKLMSAYSSLSMDLINGLLQRITDSLPGWRETMQSYHEQATKVGQRLVRLIALALNLDANFFEKPGVMDVPMAYVRLLHYSGEISNPDAGILGAGAHSDYGMLTLLITNGVPGLQICRNKNSKQQIWEDVQPVKGAFIVNLGDMLERWSNGAFRSTLHRVVITMEDRYSVAFFLDPNFDCLVECLPACCSETNPPKFPPITSGEYLEERYRYAYNSLRESMIPDSPCSVLPPVEEHNLL